MPVSIVTSLLLWATWLTPGAGSDPVGPVGVDRAPIRITCVDLTPILRSWPLQERYSWTISEADIEEEESGDGDSDGISPVESWLPFPQSRQGHVSTLRRDRAVAKSSARSPILRC